MDTWQDGLYIEEHMMAGHITAAPYVWLAWRSLVKRRPFVYVIVDGWDDDGGIEHSICIA